jgi:hypothetical protein
MDKNRRVCDWNETLPKEFSIERLVLVPRPMVWLLRSDLPLVYGRCDRQERKLWAIEHGKTIVI